MIGFEFVTSTLGRALAAAGVVLVLMGGPYLVGRMQGDNACEARWLQIVDTERTRQNTANALAKEAERIRIEAMRAEIAERDALIEELVNEAYSDPDAGRPALGADSVRRLNRIR